MIALINPKYIENVGNVIRAASCFGIDKVIYTGNRIQSFKNVDRIPREIRLYRHVELTQDDRFFDHLPAGTVPVAVELVNNAENMHHFQHPENALYVFGPEDGSIPRQYLMHCHRFVQIPMQHCANLSACVYMTLYDRMLKQEMEVLV